MNKKLDFGWNIHTIVDEDGHLNVYITNDDNSDILEIDTGQGNGKGEQLALRFTTLQIEEDYADFRAQ